MGCDIHSFAEVKRGDMWEVVGAVFPLDEFSAKWEKQTHNEHPFDWRAYGMFGLLADVRNYSHVPCISEPKYAIPDDCSDRVRSEYERWCGGAHTATWLTLHQLLDVDYDTVFWDRRVTKQVGPNSWDGAALADEGEGEHISLRELLGPRFFEHLSVLKTLGNPEDVRIVFWFDD